MNAREFLNQLNPNSHVFELSVDYRYTESQILLFAKLYHESELKNNIITYKIIFEDKFVSYTSGRKDQFQELRKLYINQYIRTNQGLKKCIDIIKE
jgi:hypothetical protein